LQIGETPKLLRISDCRFQIKVDVKEEQRKRANPTNPSNSINPINPTPITQVKAEAKVKERL